ncbi:MAG: hypothetical protein WD995_05150 [Gemmatimonadota bacterium]
MSKLTMTVVAAAILAFPGLASAQASASVQALATVLAPISVSNLQDLQFGDVIPGVATTIAPSAGDAGQYAVSGAGVLEVTLDFGTLPATLDHTLSASTLPLSFGAGSAGVGTTTGVVATTFDPSSTYTANLSGGDLFVFIGGTVAPDVSQEAGDYEGTITMTVAYTGN